MTDHELGDLASIEKLDLDSDPKPESEKIQEEISDTLKEFIKSRQDEKRDHLEGTDSEYWCCLVFDSRAQKEEFLKKMNWIQYGDKYLDGVLLATEQNIDLPDGYEVYMPTVDKRLVEISEPLDVDRNSQ